MVHKEEGVLINITQFFQITRVIQKCAVERAFPFMTTLILPYQRPNVVSHYCTVPAAFISSFHWLNILVKSLTMLLSEVTKIFLKEI